MRSSLRLHPHTHCEAVTGIEVHVSRGKAGDLLLVKGSRGVKMERIVERLLSIHAPELVAAGKASH